MVYILDITINQNDVNVKEDFVKDESDWADFYDETQIKLVPVQEWLDFILQHGRKFDDDDYQPEEENFNEEVKYGVC